MSEKTLEQRGFCTVEVRDLKLLRSSSATVFSFEIKGATEQNADRMSSLISKAYDINETNNQVSLKSLAQYICDNRLELEFAGMQNEVFKNNLILIDSFFPEIISTMLKCFFLSGDGDMRRQTENLVRYNPLGHDASYSKVFYEHKVKTFLRSISMGMVSNICWDGKEDITIGHSVLKRAGKIDCQCLYDCYEFEEFLLKNTYMSDVCIAERNCGLIEKVSDERYRLNLNLQIVFKNTAADY